MNPDELTLGQVKQIKALLGLVDAPAVAVPHPFIGKYVLCRCYAAGVHVGELVALDGERAILKNSRRLWYWKAKQGIALSGVAQFGLANGSKIDTLNPEIALSGVIEIIPMAEAARESIINY